VLRKAIHGGPDDVGLVGDKGEDVLYGGDGRDSVYAEGDGQRDELYCGEGRDHYRADHVSSSCEVKMRPPKSKGIPLSVRKKIDPLQSTLSAISTSACQRFDG
jgi:hypothetical protein